MTRMVRKIGRVPAWTAGERAAAMVQRAADREARAAAAAAEEARLAAEVARLPWYQRIALGRGSR